MDNVKKQCLHLVDRSSFLFEDNEPLDALSKERACSAYQNNHPAFGQGIQKYPWGDDTFAVFLSGPPSHRTKDGAGGGVTELFKARGARWAPSSPSPCIHSHSNPLHVCIAWFIPVLSMLSGPRDFLYK